MHDLENEKIDKAGYHLHTSDMIPVYHDVKQYHQLEKYTR